jgi:hypothetical protein
MIYNSEASVSEIDITIRIQFQWMQKELRLRQFQKPQHLSTVVNDRGG